MHEFRNIQQTFIQKNEQMISKNTSAPDSTANFIWVKNPNGIDYEAFLISGGKPRPCRSCHGEVRWAKKTNNKMIPVEYDWEDKVWRCHFNTCPAENS